MVKLREKDAFNLADVEFAIMETDGELSSQLNSQNIKDVSEVFYVGLDNTKKLHI